MKEKVTIRNTDQAAATATRSIRKPPETPVKGIRKSPENPVTGIRKPIDRTPGRKADASRASRVDAFRFAVADVLSKYKCCSCSTPIRRRGIRRVVICPVCNTANELKK